jgi:hypothetical protein
MGLRSILSPSVDMKVSLTEFWWIVGLVFVGTFLLTVLNGYLKSAKAETTIIQVQTPRHKPISDSPYTSSIVINITHRQVHSVPELWLPPSAVGSVGSSKTAVLEETKKSI